MVVYTKEAQTWEYKQQHDDRQVPIMYSPHREWLRSTMSIPMSHTHTVHEAQAQPTRTIPTLSSICSGLGPLLLIAVVYRS